MNKKGFTLVEVIVVLSIIVIISLISTVSFIGLTKSVNEKEYKKLTEQLEAATEVYFENENQYKEELLSKGIGFVLVPISKLKEEELIEESLYDSKNNLSIDDDFVKVSIDSSGELLFEYLSE